MADDPMMELLHRVLTDDSFRLSPEDEKDIDRCMNPPRHPFSYQHYTFDVLDGGAWYRIDAKVLESEFYEDIPQSVQRRARGAICAVLDSALDELNRTGRSPSILRDADHTADYERALRAEFDDVRFVETDYAHGVIW